MPGIGLSGTQFYNIGSQIDTVTTESIIQTTLRFATTFAFLLANIITNTFTGASTIISRKNTTNGNQSVSVPANTTGIFEDLVDTDSFVNGDIINMQSTAGGGGSSTLELLAMLSTSSTLTECPLCGHISSNINNNQSLFQPYGGVAASGGTVESGTNQATVRKSFTVKNGYTNVNVNNRTTTTTYKSRKNSADGNLLMSINAGVTGIFEDTVDTDSAVSGDLIDYVVVFGASAESIVVNSTKYEIENTANTALIEGVKTGAGNFVFATTEFMPIASYALGGATESNWQVTYRSKVTVNEWFVNLNMNTINGSSTAGTRINSANGNISVSIGASTSGVFEDSTDSDIYNPTDLLNYTIVIGGTSGIIRTTHTWSHITGPIPVSDTAAFTDLVQKTINKNVQDSPTFADSVSKTVNKIVNENITVSDALQILGILAIDTIVSDTDSVTALSPTTNLPITIANFPNRVLLVCVSTKAPSGVSSVSGMTIGGQALTKAGANALISQSLDSEIWYIINPPSGTNNIVITYTGLVASATLVVQGAISFYNADQLTGINPDNLSENSATFGNPNVAIIPKYTNSILVDNVVEAATGVMTGPSNSNDWSLENSSIAGASQKLQNPPAGSNTLSWVAGAGGVGFSSVAVEVLPSAVKVSISDAVQFVDSVTRLKFVSDVISSSDSVQKAISKFLEDDAGTIDTMTKLVTKAFTDSVALSDTVKVTKTKAIADSATFNDSVQKAVHHYLTDNIVTQDNTQNLIVKQVIDNVATTDLGVRTHILGIVETPQFSDSVQLSIQKLVTDNISATDTARALPIYVTDALLAGDNVSKTIGKVISDNPALIDNIQRNIGKGITDLGVWQESVNKGISKTVQDLPAFNDTVVIRLSTVHDVATMIDTISKHITKNVLDAVQAGDTVNSIKTRSPNVSESATMTDTVQKSVSKTISDFVSSSDQVGVGRFITVSDVVSASDTLKKAILKVVLDAIIVNEFLLVFLLRTINVKSHIVRSSLVASHVSRVATFKTHILRTLKMISDITR